LSQANLASELIDAAQHLISLETEAAYRRAISTAYYASFHGLIDASCGILFRDGVHADVARRNFGHREMKAAAGHFSDSTLNDEQRKCGLVSPPSEQLREICSNFVDLFEARERADYAIQATHTATQARSNIGYARNVLDYCTRPDDRAGFTALSVCMIMKSNRWKLR
jgi:uncharacterized protein (UPF0332 family)